MTRSSLVFGLVTLLALLSLQAADLISLRLFIILAAIAAVTAFTNFGRSCPLVMSLRWWLKRLSAQASATTDHSRSPDSPTIEERNR
jgi:hypothetical protein